MQDLQASKGISLLVSLPSTFCFLLFLPSVVRHLEGIVYLFCLTSWTLMTTVSRIHCMFFCLCFRLLPVSMWQSLHPQISTTSPLHVYGTAGSPPVSVCSPPSPHCHFLFPSLNSDVLQFSRFSFSSDFFSLTLGSSINPLSLGISYRLSSTFLGSLFSNF